MPGKVTVKDPFEVNLDCVHCGFCLPRCPTYQVLGDENDSPRGRIYLMDLVREGRLPLDDVVMTHLDRCLGCRACETACPSGVRYELMLNQTRGKIYENRPPSWIQRFAFRRVLPSPGLLRLGRPAGAGLPGDTPALGTVQPHPLPPPLPSWWRWRESCPRSRLRTAWKRFIRPRGRGGLASVSCPGA